jgi:hypothetical protein
MLAEAISAKFWREAEGLKIKITKGRRSRSIERNSGRR